GPQPLAPLQADHVLAPAQPPLDAPAVDDDVHAPVLQAAGQVEAELLVVVLPHEDADDPAGRRLLGALLDAQADGGALAAQGQVQVGGGAQPAVGAVADGLDGGVLEADAGPVELGGLPALLDGRLGRGGTGG